MGKITNFGQFDGIEMGVMDDGTPFLSGAGLSQMCGVVPSVITDLGEFISLDILSSGDRIPQWSDRLFYSGIRNYLCCTA